MKATIAKQFTFDAAHRLDKLPVEHKCHRMHGHTYRVEIRVRGNVRDDGFVLDYALLDEVWRPLFDQLDHRVLNEIPGLAVPSTEHVAYWIVLRIGALWAPNVDKIWVRVFESATTWCEVEGLWVVT